MSPRSTAWRSISSTTNGLPSLRAAIRSRNSSATSSASKIDAIISATPSGRSGLSVIVSARRDRRQACSVGRSGCRRWSSSLRYVHSTSTGASFSLRARWSSSSRVEPSAQWMSSTTSSAPPARAAVRSAVTIDSNSRSFACAASPTAGAAFGTASCGNNRLSSRAAPPSSAWICCGERAAKWLPSASTNGRYGSDTSASEHPPQSPVHPSASARSASSWASRVLPMPASPASRTRPPLRSRPTESSASSSAESSASRPTRASQSACFSIARLSQPPSVPPASQETPPRADPESVDEHAASLPSAPMSTTLRHRLRDAPPAQSRLTRGGRLYVLVGLAALAAFYAMPANTLFQDTVYYPAIGLTSVVAIVAGVALYRPAHPWPWILFAAGQLLFVSGDVLFGYYEH